MAVFNPQISPTQDPNYLNYAKSIDAPAPNQSGKIALETLGTGIEGAVTIADTAIKEDIKKTAFAKADEYRDRYTADLEHIKSDLDTGVIPKAVQGVAGPNAGGKPSLLDTNEEADLPAGLESGLSRIEQLAVAKASGSPRLNDTQYAKDSLSIAKQLRVQYGAGYREFIDQKVSEATGLPVANSYYQNMLTDINRQLNQMSKTKDDVGKAMMSNLDVPGMPKFIEQRKAGDPTMTDSFILGKIGDWQNLQTSQKIMAAKRAEKKDLDSDQVDEQKRGHVDTLGNSVRMEMSSLKDIGVGTTPQDLLRFFDDAANGKHPELSDAEMGQRRMQFNAWVVKVEQKLNADTYTGGPDGRSVAAIIGGDDAQKNIQKAMFPIYTMQKFVNSKEDGPAFFHAQQVEALKKDATFNFLNNKDTQALSMQMMGARDVLGEQYFPDWIRSILGSAQDQKYKDMFNEEAMNAIKPITDTRGQPLPRYMKDAIKHGKEVNAPGESGYYQEVTKLPLKIADPNMPLAAKDKLVDWAFNEKGNAKVLDELKMDYRDPNTGEWVPGKYRAFNVLASEGVAKGVASTAIVHPENYVKYRNTIESEFGRLYRSDVVTLNKIFEGKSVQVGPNGQPISGPTTLDTKVTNQIKHDTGISWNNESNSFGLVDNKNRPITRDNLSVRNPNYSALSGTLDQLDKVNGGLHSLVNVQKNDPKNKGDIGQYLLQNLQTVGLRPNGVSGATEGMIRALIKSKQPDMTNEDVNKLLKSNFASEDKGPSVQNFIRNPVGLAPREPRPRTDLEPYQTRNVIRGNISDQPEGAPIRLGQ